MRVSLAVRLLAAHVALALGGRRRGIERLFARTAAAFRIPVPPRRARGRGGRLREYALFTRGCAEKSLEGAEDLMALDRRLYGAAFGLGAGFRLRLGLRSLRDAMAAARLVYRGLGIDFEGGPNGEVVIKKCSFTSFYSPRVCALISALDRGLLAGLTGGGELEFRQRITEGADSCRACLREGKA